MSKTSDLIKKSHSKRGAPGTLKAKVKGKMTLAKARALKNRPGATTSDKKQANFFINMHSESIDEAATPRWKKAGPNGEIEITIKGQRYQIEKALDHNERHKGEWKIMMWDKRRRDWVWDNTVRGKAYAKELVMDKLDEDAAATSTAVIPNPAQTAMGPKFKAKNVTDRRRRKDKQPLLLKRFRKYMEDNG